MSKYKKLSKTIRVQMGHGFGSFGVTKKISRIERADALFLTTRFQWHQLKTQYKKQVAGKRIFRIGYPKIDRYITVNEKKKIIDPNNVTLFYGPTYHREISSIFDFLPEIINICRKNNYRLIIKLHPLLYHKRNYDQSGRVDWVSRIHKYKQSFNRITLVKKKEMDLTRYFAATDIFLTDVSGIGFEFVLATSKSIIFMGDKLKIPLQDLRKGNIKKYDNHAEIYYRSRIGPIVSAPSDLEPAVKRIIQHNDYEAEIAKFQNEFVFNLGTACDTAASELKKILKEL